LREPSPLKPLERQRDVQVVVVVEAGVIVLVTGLLVDNLQTRKINRAVVDSTTSGTLIVDVMHRRRLTQEPEVLDVVPIALRVPAKSLFDLIDLKIWRKSSTLPVEPGHG
jgi:hypothetical protein